MGMRMRDHFGLIVFVCATLLSSRQALAQFSQQGPKLVGTGAVGLALQGYSVSLSADGNTAIVGGPTDNNIAGCGLGLDEKRRRLEAAGPQAGRLGCHGERWTRPSRGSLQRR